MRRIVHCDGIRPKRDLVLSTAIKPVIARAMLCGDLLEPYRTREDLILLVLEKR